MLRISHAILHAFDFESGAAYPSERELDLDTHAVKSYVQRRLRSISSSPESRHGEFSEKSAFAAGLGEYASGQFDFIELSQQLARFMWEELRLCDELEQCDLLVADFTDTREIGSRASQSDDDQVAQAPELPDSEDLTERFFAAVLLPRKQAFVHDLGADSTGASANDIVRQDSTLPSPAQKVDTYVVVNLSTGAIDFHDKVRLCGSAEIEIIANKLLQCEVQASSREVVESVEQIVEEVAEECGVNPVEAVARAKHVVRHNADIDETFSPEEVGRHVFEDHPEAQERYEQAAREKQLPEEVSVKRSAANRMAKNHKIKTDTGIEITFPSEYAADANYIEFTADAEGYVSILIKNVGKIENK